MDERQRSMKTSANIPSWAITLLDLYQDSDEFFKAADDSTEDFQRRCQLSGRIAASLMVLRRERALLGFLPVPFSEYFKALELLSRVPLNEVLQYFGLSDLSPRGQDQATRLARFVALLGFSLREATLHLKVGLLGQLQPNEVSLFAAHSRSGLRSKMSIADIEARLVSIESELDISTRNGLRNVERAFRSAFEQS